MTTANKYQELFESSEQMWATMTGCMAAEYIVNLALPLGELSSINIIGDVDPTIWFEDGSLLIFKKGSWVERGFYAQVQ